jgi:hypothetical protein
MAFIAGVIVGGVIGAFIVAAYTSGRLKELDRQTDGLTEQITGTINTQALAISMQKNMINALRYKLGIYKDRYGELDEEES